MSTLVVIALALALVGLVALLVIIWEKLHPPAQPDEEEPTPIVDIVPPSP